MTESKSDVEVSEGYRWYVLGLLTFIYVINIIDRSILSILQEPIKLDLGLSDTQLGALSGLAFALFYATLSIPIARLADRGVRTLVLSVCLALWSLTTALCGLAQNFVTLLLFRIGVGVGEAGGVPPATSIISDYFRQNRRATAMSIYGLGPPIGVMIGIAAGGWLAEYVGWRNTFYVIGVLGIVIAPIAYFTLRELPRGHSDRVAGQPVQALKSASFGQVVRTLWRLRSFRHLAVAGAAHGFASYSMTNWNPSFYVRVHELSTAEAGTYLGVIIGTTGILGTLLGGALSDRLGAKDARWYMWVPGFAMLFAVPVALAQYLIASPYVSFAYAAFSGLLATVYIGPFIATAQSIVDPHMRATTQAVILMTFNIFGLALGPFLTGILSDTLNFGFGFGVDSLRYAICVTASFNLWAALQFFYGSRYLRADLERDRINDGETNEELSARIASV